MTLAIELNDRAIEAQACYSLGNTHTLLRDYETAIEYHLRHLIIAQELLDKIGESRAYWSLSNAYMALENPQKALYFANKHLDSSKDLNDSDSQRLAKTNVEELKKILSGRDCSSFLSNDSKHDTTATSSSSSSSTKIRRDSMDHMNLLKLTPDAKKGSTSSGMKTSDVKPKGNDQESFFDLLESVQSRRIDEQRVQLPPKEKKTTTSKFVHWSCRVKPILTLVPQYFYFHVQNNRSIERKVWQSFQKSEINFSVVS